MKKKILAVALVALLLTTCLLPCTTAFAVEESETNVSYKDFVTGATEGGSLIIEGCPTLVTLEYLERIEGTPFATLKSKEITVPLSYHLDSEGNKILNLYSLDINDFLDAMELSSFGVLQSYVKNFDFKGIVDGLPKFKAIGLSCSSFVSGH